MQRRDYDQGRSNSLWTSISTLSACKWWTTLLEKSIARVNVDKPYSGYVWDEIARLQREDYSVQKYKKREQWPYRYVLTLVDYETRYPEAVPLIRVVLV